MLEIIIGNKNYSSWSLRPWLLLKQLEIEFKESRIPLYEDASKEHLLMYSSSGKVPVLKTEEITIWDSLAICEYIAESYPEKHAWPKNKQSKALARSVSSEMHSSFMEMRNVLPMNCRKKMVFSNITSALQSDIDRICQIWRECLTLSNGPFLFGEFSIADAMFAPVVLRFNSYGIKVGDAEAEYMHFILSLGSLQDWINEGMAEKELISVAEVT